MRLLTYISILLGLGSCSQDVLPEYLAEEKVYTENLQAQASFVADFDEGIFVLNGNTGSKASLVDPYRIEPRGTNGGVKDNALLFPLQALGVTGDQWSYWIELTFPDNIHWTEHSFFAESGTTNRSNRIVHRVTPAPDLRCVSEFFGDEDARFLGSERSSFSVGSGTKILIQQSIDASSIVTQLGNDPAGEKKGVLPNRFEQLAVGVDLMGFQDFPDIKINRVMVFNKKLHDSVQNKGYDVSSFTEVVFFDGFDSLNLRSGTPNNYWSGQGIWTPRYSYTDNDLSFKGWSTGNANYYNADPTFNWPDGWLPFNIENSILKIRMDRTAETNLISAVPINTANGKPYEWIGGVLTTKHSHSFKAPCYVEARIKFPPGQGLWNAFWLYNNYDGHKEIDIAEQWTANITNYGIAQHGFNGSNIIHDALQLNSGIDLTQDYHRYGVVWADSKLVFLLDGKEVYTMPQQSSLTGRELYIVLNSSIGGWQCEPNKTTPDRNVMLVDWVRVKKRP